MHFSFLALLSLGALTLSAANSVQHDSQVFAFEFRDLMPYSRQALISKFEPPHIDHLAKRIALAKGGGGGGGGKGGGGGAKSGGGKGGKKGKDKKGHDQDVPGTNGGGIEPAPPGLSAGGTKAWNDCQRASNPSGDCNDMIGMFAAAGCSQARAKQMAPCSNKEVQGYLSKQYCKKNPKGKGC